MEVVLEVRDNRIGRRKDKLTGSQSTHTELPTGGPFSGIEMRLALMKTI